MLNSSTMSEYYYLKWKKLLEELEKHIELDLEYQATKAHDQTCREAATRLSGVLSKYMAFCNDGKACLHENLQVQKTIYIEDVINAISDRIMELQSQLRKLESLRYQFLGNGLTQNLLTFNDVEPKYVLPKAKRSERLQIAIDAIMLRARKKREDALLIASIDKDTLIEDHLLMSIWDSDDESSNKTIQMKKELSKETLKRIEMVKLIQAHVRSGQAVRWSTKRMFKRTMWEKELKGTLKPQANTEVKERAGGLIQKVMRAYFHLKRDRINQCKADELLQINFCEKPKTLDEINKVIMKHHLKKQTQLKEEWKSNCEDLRKEYARKVQNEFAEEHRDVIRNWFRKWYDEVNYFYNIPKLEHGGTTLIVKEEVPSPREWQEEYEAYLEEKKANKNKTSLQIKWEKLEAKKEETLARIAERRKHKQEEALIRKLKKNPKMHPGFNYPSSKVTKQITNAIKSYNNQWKDIDAWEIEGFKQGFVKDFDESDAWMEIKMAAMNSVDDDMREELKSLKKALANDYKQNNEKMPEAIKRKIERPKRKRRLKSTIKESVEDKLEELATAGILKERTGMKLEDFLVEFNYVGDDLRCALQPALPLGGEIKCLWWGKLFELFHGSQRFLLVGPNGCGKSTLVHIMAGAGNAMLFELDPTKFSPETMTRAKLHQIASNVITCARAVQPATIHLKCLELLYCKKAPLGENKKNLDLFKQSLVHYLLKKIHKTDLITVIGSCCDPWLTNTNNLLLKFPDVILVPDTTYPTISMILRQWKNTNRVVPRNLNLQSVAHLLQGYPFGHLKESLDSFLTPERIVKIAAYGLSSQDLFEHITGSGHEEKVDYKKYLDWYVQNTMWGKKEEKRVNDDKEFELLVQKFAEKERKKESKEKYNQEEAIKMFSDD